MDATHTYVYTLGEKKVELLCSSLLLARKTYPLQASQAHLEKHYEDLKSKPFFPGLVKYMASGPVVAMVWEGLGVVKTGRVMLGETNPRDSKPGTIRGDFCIQVSLGFFAFSTA